MPTLDEMLAKSGELTQAQKRAARLRATQEQFTAMGQTPIRSGVTRTQDGGLYQTVGSYVPDYGGYARQIAGALGGYYSGKKADEAEIQSDTARNEEILRTVEAIGQIRQQPAGQQGNAGVTEQALRGYLSVLGGPDVKDILGKQAHVSGIKTDNNGDMIIVMSDGSEKNTGRKMDYNTQIITDPVTGEVSIVGKSGAGRGVASPVTMGGAPNTPAPMAAPGGVVAPPDVGGQKPVIDVPEVNPNVQAMIQNGVAFMQSLNLPQETQDAWVAEQIGKARSAQAYAQSGGQAPQAAPVGAPAATGTPLRVSGVGEQAAARTQAEIAAQAANAGTLANIEGLKVEARQGAEKKVELQSTLPRMKGLADGMSRAIAELKAKPGLDSIVGGSIMGTIPNEGNVSTVARGVQSILNPEGADALAAYDNVVGKVYQQAFETLKGGGPITEKETERVANAYAALQRTQSKEEFIRNLDELDAAIKAGYERMQQVAAQFGAAPAAPAAAPTRPALPAGFEWSD